MTEINTTQWPSRAGHGGHGSHGSHDSLSTFQLRHLCELRTLSGSIQDDFPDKIAAGNRAPRRPSSTTQVSQRPRRPDQASHPDSRHQLPNPVNHAATVGAVDVHYDDAGKARAALVTCLDLTFSTVSSEHVVTIARTAPYEPGALYKRELPCIQAVLANGPPLKLLVIDGFATLDPAGRPGLGAHAAAAIGIPVIGVAKRPFRTATHAAQVIRGKATRPLYVTAAGGLTNGEAARIVAAMTGPNRLPAVLARVDILARGRDQPIVAVDTV